MNTVLCLLFTLAIVPMVHSVPAKVLIYSATKDFRHDSIPTAIGALKAKESSINVSFDNTEDPSTFNDHSLAIYDAVVFLSTTGEVLDDAGKAAFQKYLNLGGNFVGIHAASSSLVHTSFFGRELGAYLDYHPPLQNAIVDILDKSHPSTNMLPSQWHIRDEMYNFKSDPRSVGATVIIAANESSYVDDGTRKFHQGSPHPLAWFQERGAGVDAGATHGRSFYTALGHLKETWQDPMFLGHVLGGIQWTLQSKRSANPNGQVTTAGTATAAGPTTGGATAGTATAGGATAGGSTAEGATAGGATAGGATTGDATAGSTTDSPTQTPSSPSASSRTGIPGLISTIAVALLVGLT